MEKYPFIYQKKDTPLEIVYGFHLTHLGSILLGQAKEGVCHLSFIEKNALPLALQQLQKYWPNSTLKEGNTQTKHLLKRIFEPTESLTQMPLPLLIQGTPLQQRVWQALLAIPCGQVVSYSFIAQQVGQPRAVRAVASQIAKNEISYLIPCHRVVRKSGHIHHYRWGVQTKRALLNYENAKGFLLN